MKTSAMGSSNNFKGQLKLQHTPKSEVLSRQIESLRVVLRRVQMSDSGKLDSLINQKLGKIQ